jgi:hypothetical protein
LFLLITEIILVATIFRQRKANFRLVSGNGVQRCEVAVSGANTQFLRNLYATFANPTTVEVILVPSVILAGFRPSQRLGSHEREITDIGTGNNFGNNRTTFIIPYFGK